MEAQQKRKEKRMSSRGDISPNTPSSVADAGDGEQQLAAPVEPLSNKPRSGTTDDNENSEQQVRDDDDATAAPNHHPASRSPPAGELPSVDIRRPDSDRDALSEEQDRTSPGLGNAGLAASAVDNADEQGGVSAEHHAEIEPHLENRVAASPLDQQAHEASAPPQEESKEASHRPCSTTSTAEDEKMKDQEEEKNAEKTAHREEEAVGAEKSDVPAGDAEEASPRRSSRSYSSSRRSASSSSRNSSSSSGSSYVPLAAQSSSPDRPPQTDDAADANKNSSNNTKKSTAAVESDSKEDANGDKNTTSVHECQQQARPETMHGSRSSKRTPHRPPAQLGSSTARPLTPHRQHLLLYITQQQHHHHGGGGGGVAAPLRHWFNPYTACNARRPILVQRDVREYEAERKMLADSHREHVKELEKIAQESATRERPKTREVAKTSERLCTPKYQRPRKDQTQKEEAVEQQEDEEAGQPSTQSKPARQTVSRTSARCVTADSSGTTPSYMRPQRRDVKIAATSAHEDNIQHHTTLSLEEFTERFYAQPLTVHEKVIKDSITKLIHPPDVDEYYSAVVNPPRGINKTKHAEDDDEDAAKKIAAKELYGETIGARLHDEDLAHRENTKQQLERKYNCVPKEPRPPSPRGSQPSPQEVAAAQRLYYESKAKSAAKEKSLVEKVIGEANKRHLHDKKLPQAQIDEAVERNVNAGRRTSPVPPSPGSKKKK